MDEEINIKNNEWINASQRFYPEKRIIEPKVDEIVSKIVGFKVFVQDPRLLKLVVKWKRENPKSDDDLTPDNFLDDPKKVEELKSVLKGNLC